MKLAISGKGGVGKTTISALIASAFQSLGQQVVAIDADPDSNLLACMGYPTPEAVPPLVQLKDLIEERTGVKPGSIGGMFKLNPRVDDLLGKYAVDVDGVQVLVAGAVKKGGSGCYCPENALVRALVGHRLVEPDTTLVLDMEAGVEHLGRGTVESVDRLLVVADPGRRAVETAGRIHRLAADIGLTRVGVVGNRIRSLQDEVFLREALPDMDFVGFVPFDEGIVEAEREGRTVTAASSAATAAVRDIVTHLMAETESYD